VQLPALQLSRRPGLLVSVRDADEALAALAGGADVIDVKEPTRGSLGAADPSSLASVIRAVDGRAPVTAAAGELVDLQHTRLQPLPADLALFKIGLAGCGTMHNWRFAWRTAIAALSPVENPCERAVAVAYADWHAADAPDPYDVLELASSAGCPALLVDTYDKSAGALFDVWNLQSVTAFSKTVRAHNLLLVLAGSLTGSAITTAGRLGADLVAVRTAACKSGRNSPVCKLQVERVRDAILDAVPASTPSG
jgi:(5-formylfuran-3-yl)methyl phosphate synthase